MLRIPEDRVKAWLHHRGLPVPPGTAVSSPREAENAAVELGGKVVVKALVPTGRRGKAGAVIVAPDPMRAHVAARELLGRTVNGYPVEEVYIEAFTPIERELYLGFAFAGTQPTVALSTRGGVDLEEVVTARPTPSCAWRSIRCAGCDRGRRSPFGMRPAWRAVADAFGAADGTVVGCVLRGRRADV